MRKCFKINVFEWFWYHLLNKSVETIEKIKHPTQALSIKDVSLTSKSSFEVEEFIRELDEFISSFQEKDCKIKDKSHTTCCLNQSEIDFDTNNDFSENDPTITRIEETCYSQIEELLIKEAMQHTETFIIQEQINQALNQVVIERRIENKTNTI